MAADLSAIASLRGEVVQIRRSASQARALLAPALKRQIGAVRRNFTISNSPCNDVDWIATAQICDIVAGYGSNAPLACTMARYLR